LQDFNLNALRGFISLPCGEKDTTTHQTTTNKTTAIYSIVQTKHMKNKKTFNTMNKPICVRTSVHVKPAASFNEWQQGLKEERDFLRLIDNLKSQIKTGKTI